MAWTPPTTGGVPTCYNVSINDSSSPVVIPATCNEASLYTHIFTGLISDTLYTVSVVAINCAGSSNVTSVYTRTCKWTYSSTADDLCVLCLNISQPCMFFMFATDIVVHLKYTCIPVMEHHWVTKVNKYCLVANDHLRGNFKAWPCKCPSTVAALLRTRVNI